MLLLSLALAQTPPDSDNIGVPQLDADLAHRALATRRTLLVEDAGRIRDEAVGGFQVGFGYANAPLVVSWDAGGGREQVSLLRDALVADLVATLEYDRFRLGLDVPVYLLATSDLAPSGQALGNVAFDGRLTLLDPTRDPTGLALLARIDLPSPDADRAVGSDRVGFELAAAGEHPVGPVSIAANLGYRALPREPLYNIVWDDLAFARLAVSYDVTEQAGVSVEGLAAVVLPLTGADPLGEARGAPTPAELLASGWVEPIEGFQVRAGVGSGLTRGIGTPRFRGLVDVVWTPQVGPSDTDGDLIRNRDDVCPEEPEDRDGYADEDGCPDWDNDSDGLEDSEDPCPDAAEDLDGFEDDDGCPDPKATILVRMLDERGQPVPGAILQVSGEGLEPTAAKELELHAGEYKAVAFAPGHVTSQTTFTVTGGRDEVVSIQLERNPPGVARVRVVPPEGGSVPAALAVRIGERVVTLVDGMSEAQVPAGNVAISIPAAGGLAAWRGVANVRSGGEIEVEIRLSEPRIEVGQGRIRASEPVRFIDGSATVSPESEGLLGEITAALHDSTDLKLKIVSHTRTRGNADQNLALSTQRAEALRRRLTRAGIDGRRVEAVGRGGTEPLPGKPDSRNERIEWLLVE